MQNFYIHSAFFILNLSPTRYSVFSLSSFSNSFLSLAMPRKRFIAAARARLSFCSVSYSSLSVGLKLLKNASCATLRFSAAAFDAARCSGVRGLLGFFSFLFAALYSAIRAFSAALSGEVSVSSTLSCSAWRSSSCAAVSRYCAYARRDASSFAVAASA